ncbi:hypothetical protein [Bdellovibrio sp. HCB274]|uniref:hypothetical protein n=1 Tax=Bdellovibrio sp. HCB274 TaxID=3394361 RepID=UPI0039B46D88
MFQLKPDSIVFVQCHPRNATGGTELLHQLVYKLRRCNIDARIFYHPWLPSPTPDRFSVYDVLVADKVIDRPENVLIAPEIRTDLVYKYKKIQKCIWWLSVDNFFGHHYVNSTGLKRIVKRILYGKMRFDFKNGIATHLVQSEYAKQFLLSKGIFSKDIHHLGDYLSSSFFKKSQGSDIPREKLVLYNPVKGFATTKKLMELAPDIKFVALEKLTPEQVSNLLSKGMVYIDFGNHPGKDRFPREAAISGACIIVGMKGSAKYYEDVPIPAEYKFQDEDGVEANIINKIRECFEQFEVKTKDFDHYRNIIRAEEEKFESDLKLLFLSSPK